MIIGNHIIHLGSVFSTSNYLKDMANCATEGTVVLADQQTQGKGRFGRSWFSNSGSLTFSLLLQPKLPMQSLLMFTLFPAVSVVKVLRAFQLFAGLKWPNDILLNGKKIGGILVERIASEHGHNLIIGIGLNLHQSANEFPEELSQAGSVFSESGRLLERENFFKAVLRQLDSDYELIQKTNDVTHVKKEWLTFCAHLNQSITVTFQNQRLTGEFLGITNKGTAQVATQNKVFEITNVTELCLRSPHVTRN